MLVGSRTRLLPTLVTWSRQGSSRHDSGPSCSSLFLVSAVKPGTNWNKKERSCRSLFLVVTHKIFYTERRGNHPRDASWEVQDLLHCSFSSDTSPPFLLRHPEDTDGEDLPRRSPSPRNLLDTIFRFPGSTSTGAPLVPRTQVGREPITPHLGKLGEAGVGGWRPFNARRWGEATSPFKVSLDGGGQLPASSSPFKVSLDGGGQLPASSHHHHQHGTGHYHHHRIHHHGSAGEQKPEQVVPHHRTTEQHYHHHRAHHHQPTNRGEMPAPSGPPAESVSGGVHYHHHRTHHHQLSGSGVVQQQPAREQNGVHYHHHRTHHRGPGGVQSLPEQGTTTSTGVNGAYYRHHREHHHSGGQ